VALNGIAFAMMGLIYGLIHWLLYCSGVRASKGYFAGETCQSGCGAQEKTMGVMGQLAAGFGLLFMAIWLNIDATIGPSWSPFVVVAGALYGFKFLATAFACYFQLDQRPIGDACIIGGVTQFIILPFAALAGLPWDALLGFSVWGILIANNGLLIHKRISPKVQQANLVAGIFVAWWFMVFHGGMYPLPSVFVGYDTEMWAIVMVVIGVLAAIYMIYNMFMKRK